jgi:hypothetical protein
MSEIREPDARSLEAVYNLNKHAKKYARLADENYRSGKGATAKANSLKKKALYAVKSRAINRFLLDGGDALRDVERHEINGEPFLCLYFECDGETWSFHQPEDDVITDRFPERVAITDRPADDFEDFESGEVKDRSDMSLKDTLKHLQSCGITANNYLEQTHVQYGRNSHFVGWKYLD